MVGTMGGTEARERWPGCREEGDDPKPLCCAGSSASVWVELEQRLEQWRRAIQDLRQIESSVALAQPEREESVPRPTCLLAIVRAQL